MAEMIGTTDDVRGNRVAPPLGWDGRTVLEAPEQLLNIKQLLSSEDRVALFRLVSRQGRRLLFARPEG